MADWYVSSAAYTAIAAFVPSVAYSVGNIVKPTAPSQGARWAFRCTTAGTASTEPTWTTANNSTISTGGATFTNVTGQSTYFWAAAAGDHQTLNGTVGTVRYAAGDRVFISSDHTETVTSGHCGAGSTIAQSYGILQFLSVSRAGSTPPAAADMATGATITVNGATLILRARVNVFYSGISFTQASNNQVVFNDLNNICDKTAYYQNCAFYSSTANAGAGYNGNIQKVVLDNTTVRFGHAGQNIGFANADLVWVNTPSAIPGATLPTSLFSSPATNIQNLFTVRGVDLSAITGTLVTGSANAGAKYLFDSCRIASAVTRYSGSGNTTDIVEFVNCYDGTSILNESYQPSGSVTTEFTITLFGGATDNVGAFSHKLVSNANIDKFANVLAGFWLDVNYATTGSTKTATVEIVGSATLNNDEISLVVEYLGASGSSLASFGSSFISTPLTTPSAVTSSSATWNSLPTTPVRQHLQVSFTPRTAGRVRAQVRLGKASTTVYYDPQVTIT